MLSRQILAALAAVALFASADTTAIAQTVTVGPITVTEPWTRATPPNAPTAAGYLTIANDGSEADRLIAAASPMAETTQLHTMEVKNGVMSMHAVEGGIEIPAGGSVTLAPGGFHIMFITLQGTLKEGDTLPVTLTFAKAGSVETALPVMAIGAKGPSMGAIDMDDMMDHGPKAPADRSEQ